TEFRAPTPRTFCARRNAIRFRRVPGVGTATSEKLDYFSVDGSVVQRLPTFSAQEHGNGHAPYPLARDAPVGARGNHVGDSFLAPRRIPLHLLDLLERTTPQRAAAQWRFHRDEPLFGGAENHRFVAPPAVRVGMLYLL